jgi:hypothetical protein
MRAALVAALALAGAAVTPAVVTAASPIPVGGLTQLPALEPGRNLLQNPGFESAPESSGIPGWRIKTDTDVWSVDRAGRTGGASLKMTNAESQKFVVSGDQTVTLDAGYYTIEGWVKAANVGDAANRSGVRVCLDARPRINWWNCTKTIKGTADWTHLRQPAIPVTDPGTYRLTVGAYGRPGGVAWFDDLAVVKLRRPPIEAFLLYPNFRGMLFDDRSQTIRVAVQVNEAGAADARVRVSVVDESGTAVRQSREYPASAERRDAELDAGALPLGTYLLRAELVSRGGEVLARYPDYRIVKLKGKTREKLNYWYDEQNVLHRHGKPMFVIGLYNTSGYSTSPGSYARGADGWGNDRIGKAPFNMMINYWLGAAPVPALWAYMDDLYAHGMSYLQTVNFYEKDDPQYAKLPYAAAKDGEDALNRWVGKELSGHRALAGFYTADERTAERVPNVFKQHRELRAAAPGTIDFAVIGDGWQEQAPLWRDVVDVLGMDPYPIAKKGDNHLAMVGEWTRMGQDAVMASRPVWAVLQFFPINVAAGWPTAEQLHAMSWMAIVEGARGVLYWSFGARGLAWVKDPKEREAHWNDLVRVTQDIKALEPVLLAPDAAIVSKESSGGKIRMLGKRMPDGSRYLFAYNATNAPVAVTWTLADPAREASPLGGGPAVKTDGGALTDNFGPYEVKRYRIN